MKRRNIALMGGGGLVALALIGSLGSGGGKTSPSPSAGNPTATNDPGLVAGGSTASPAAATAAVTMAPTVLATVAPTPAPTPTPPPAPKFATFGDGTWSVGTEIQPGTYRIRSSAFGCYWARLSGFGGTLGEIMANGNVFGGYAVVTISKTDKGFQSSGCNLWSSDLSSVGEGPLNGLDGTFIVGKEIGAGTFKSTTGPCYWARLRGFSGTLGDIIANDNSTGGTIVTIRSTDKGFETSGCGTWKKV